MNMYVFLYTLTDRAKRSKFWLWVLNVLLGRVIPFNRPHGFKLLLISDHVIRTGVENRRSNQNHLKGIHACAIATVAEFSAGFLLLSKLDPRRYRLIMSKIDIDYLFQAKESIVSESSLSPETLSNDIIAPLQAEGSILVKMQSNVDDISGNEIAHCCTTWQIKRWDRVRTQL
ncbi:MAG: DUF4442 domain-containing protein [Deltaproteobacteria bacterium]|nr:DUF4442 domain-containing protein [Deltaproteobacteria bacterium]